MKFAPPVLAFPISRLTFAIVLLLAQAACLAARPAEYEVVVETDIMVPMRNGVRRRSLQPSSIRNTVLPSWSPQIGQQGAWSSCRDGTFARSAAEMGWGLISVMAADPS
jgi:hypothetical protein